MHWLPLIQSRSVPQNLGLEDWHWRRTGGCGKTEQVSFTVRVSKSINVMIKVHFRRSARKKEKGSTVGSQSVIPPKKIKNKNGLSIWNSKNVDLNTDKWTSVSLKAIVRALEVRNKNNHGGGVWIWTCLLNIWVSRDAKGQKRPRKIVFQLWKRRWRGDPPVEWIRLLCWGAP